MAIVKTIIKNTHLEAVVKFVGTGTSTLTLAELKLALETAGAYAVDIVRAQYATQPTTKISVTRNAVDVLQVFGGGTIEPGGRLAEQNTQDIVVTSVGDGTLLLTLRKVGGFEPFLTRANTLTVGA